MQHFSTRNGLRTKHYQAWPLDSRAWARGSQGLRAPCPCPCRSMPWLGRWMSEPNGLAARPKLRPKLGSPPSGDRSDVSQSHLPLRHRRLRAPSPCKSAHQWKLLLGSIGNCKKGKKWQIWMEFRFCIFTQQCCYPFWPCIGCEKVCFFRTGKETDYWWIPSKKPHFFQLSRCSQW